MDLREDFFVVVSSTKAFMHLFLTISSLITVSHTTKVPRHCQDFLIQTEIP